MSLRPGLLVAASLLLVAAGIPAPAGEDASRDGGPVKVWTNADLLRMFGPPPPSPPRTTASTAENEARDREFVQSVIDREYARIRADEEQTLRRRELGYMEPSGYVGDSYYGWMMPWGWTSGSFDDCAPRHPSRQPYYSPYSPKPGQPGWNELAMRNTGGPNPRAPYLSPYSPKPGQPGWSQLVHSATRAGHSRGRR